MLRRIYRTTSTMPRCAGGPQRTTSLALLTMNTGVCAEVTGSALLCPPSKTQILRH
jgi:hypothetical protein